MMGTWITFPLHLQPANELYEGVGMLVVLCGARTYHLHAKEYVTLLHQTSATRTTPYVRVEIHAPKILFEGIKKEATTAHAISKTISKDVTQDFMSPFRNNECALNWSQPINTKLQSRSDKKVARV